MHRYIKVFFVAVLVTICLSGCSGILNSLIGKQYSYNYAQEAGVTANDPKVIDGKLKTVGKSVFVADFGEPAHMFKIENPEKPLANNYASYERYIAPPSETVITLPERKMIHKIVIHSENLVDFVVQARDDYGRWNTVYDQKAENLRNNKNNLKKNYTMYNMDGKDSSKQFVVAGQDFPVFTDAIRIYVKRTTDDATQRRKNTEPGYHELRWWFDRKPGRIITRRVNGYIVSPALIREVEVYGYVSEK